MRTYIVSDGYIIYEYDDSDTTSYTVDTSSLTEYYTVTNTRNETQRDDRFIKNLTYLAHKKDCQKIIKKGVKDKHTVRSVNFKFLPYYKRRVLRCNRKGIGLRI